ncbi:MAG: AAA family ATPase, partial [SAR324 cluster bacterium]|nr:AAA family ATPase [SAR324 cluster bacterium]
FHERICFRAPKNCTYWIIRKDSGCSSVQGFKRNPIRSSYALLWKEVANPYRSIITIRNTLRRILEHYFEVICGNNLHTMVDGFVEDRDTSISNFMSWINDGSHGLGGEEYTEPNPQAIKYYLDVFKNIFTKSGQITHYNMMMKNNENNE